MKARASKVRRLFHGQVVCGFAGAVADALTLFDKFEQHLDKHQGNLVRAAIGLSKEWRTDKYLRRLEAMLIVADANRILLLSGDGEVIEPDDGDGVVAIGSGGPYAHAAAAALLSSTDLGAEEIARRALLIAARLCIYTNDNITVETLELAAQAPAAPVTGVTSAVAVEPGPDADPESRPRPGRGGRRGDAPSCRGRAPARRIHHRPARGEAIGRHRAAQPGATPDAPRGHAQRGAAQEHPDDRTDRRRQDRDRAAGGAAHRVAVHQGGGDQVHRGRLRGPRRRVDPPRPARADHHRAARGPRRRGRAAGSCPRRRAPRRQPARGERAPATAREPSLPKTLRTPEHVAADARRARARRRRIAHRLDAGTLEDASVDIEVEEPFQPAFEGFTGTGLEEVGVSLSDFFSPARAAAQAQEAHDRRRRARRAHRRGDRPAHRHGPRLRRRDPPRRGLGRGLHRRGRQDLRAGLGPRPGRQRRGCPARPAPDPRRLDGAHPLRAGAHRPRPLHRCGRIHRRPAERPHPRVPGSLSDPGRAQAAQRGRPRSHPHRARQRADAGSTRPCSAPSR